MLSIAKSRFLSGKKIIFTLLIIHCSLIIANAQWVNTAFTHFDEANDIEATDSSIHISFLQSGIYRSYDNGNSVTAINNGLPGLLQIPCVKIKDIMMYAGNLYDGIYKSTNNGLNWFSINDSSTNTLCVYDIYKFNQNLFIGTTNSIFMSTNEGLNWISIRNNLPITWVPVVFYFSNKIFAGGYYIGLYTSTNMGTNWIKCQNGFPDSCGVTDYTILNNVLFVSTFQNGIFKSSDYGLTWVDCTQGISSFVASICSSSNLLFAAITGFGVSYSSNYGQTWNPINNNGITQSFDVHRIKSNTQYLFAGTYNSGVWRRPISEIIGIQNIGTEIPSRFSLFQNYPNPFNPTTTIKFDIPKLSNVKISVNDITGKELEVLVNEQLQAGTYQTDWNASNFSSGVYFYRLQTEDFSETKKLILLK